MEAGKRKYPLFIVDTSRQHGRGKEIDFIACTSSECPFVATVTIHTEAEYERMYDKNDYLSIYSQYQSNKLRMRIHIVEIAHEHDKTIVRTLLQRALKDMLKRRKLAKVNTSNITNKNVIVLISALMEQAREYIRNKDDSGVNMTLQLAILQKIYYDYTDEE